MSEEKRFNFALTINEAVIIKAIRAMEPFGQITIHKANGEICRVQSQETYLMKDFLKKHGFEKTE